jgi:hypothetical protein
MTVSVYATVCTWHLLPSGWLSWDVKQMPAPQWMNGCILPCPSNSHADIIQPTMLSTSA